MRIREGGPADAAAVLALFDEAVAWLVARGQTGQWGSKPFSEIDARVGAAAEWAASGGLRIAARARSRSARSCSARARSASPPPTAAERYIAALVTSRAHAGRTSAGSSCTARSRRRAPRGLALLRVDCWAGRRGWSRGTSARASSAAAPSPCAAGTAGLLDGAALGVGVVAVVQPAHARVEVHVGLRGVGAHAREVDDAVLVLGVQRVRAGLGSGSPWVSEQGNRPLDTSGTIDFRPTRRVGSRRGRDDHVPALRVDASCSRCAARPRAPTSCSSSCAARTA